MVMAEHNMLWNSSNAHEDLGHSAMKSGKKGESSDVSSTAVSVFGRGASSAQSSAQLDFLLACSSELCLTKRSLRPARGIVSIHTTVRNCCVLGLG